MSNTNQKIETLNKLRTVEAIYVLMSSCTRMPYVVCDPETFDDEILLYYTEAEAKEEAMKLQKEGNPMQLVKVDENSRLSFLPGCFRWESTVFWWTKGWTDRLLCSLTN